MLRKKVKYTVLLFVLGCVSFFQASAGGEWTLRKDLKSEWMVYTQNRYEPFISTKAEASTIYFWIPAVKFSRDYLRIKSTEPLTVFINGQLIAQTKGLLSFRIDSLSDALSSSTLLIGIHQNKIRSGRLETTIETPGVAQGVAGVSLAGHGLGQQQTGRAGQCYLRRALGCLLSTLARSSGVSGSWHRGAPDADAHGPLRWLSPAHAGRRRPGVRLLSQVRIRAGWQDRADVDLCRP